MFRFRTDFLSGTALTISAAVTLYNENVDFVKIKFKFV